MMKHLWLYPLIFILMGMAILACTLQLGWMLRDLQSPAIVNAQFVREVSLYETL